ncbi:MAG: GAF domain-containing protein [Anaerolineaceae bacterium]|nr:GAF domain-containing protein [Anaerolineaceae bacterium]
MKRLLIVDDLPQNAYLLEVLLKTNGFEVETAANGIEALDLAHKNPPEMVISDILMPGMDGFSLCRAWMADERLKDIPFVFYTATYTDPRDEKLALSLGAERFMVKPMEPDAFMAVLQEIIQANKSEGQVAHKGAFKNEDVFYKEYNEALIRKLEDKMIQLERSNKRLASLYQASCDLHTTKPSTDFIYTILHAIVETAGYQQASYFWFDDNLNTLYLLASVGFPEDTVRIFNEKFIFNLGENQGFVGLVATKGQTINIADTSNEPDWIPLDQTIKSALFTPVYFEKNLLGVIALFSKEKDSFNEEDEHNIAALANTLAIAIENNKNQEKIKKQLARMSALHNIDIAINGTMDLNITLNILLRHVTTQLKVDAADVLLSRLDTSNYEYTAGFGFNTPKIKNNNIRKGKSLDKKVVIERRIVQVIELTESEVSPEFTNMWAAEGFSTYIGVPLIAKGKMAGVLEVFHRSQFDPDAEWIDYFDTLAGQAAIAIDNARIFNDLQRSNIELIVAYDATINGWSRAMDLRDQETEGHTQRVTEITVRFAKILGISDEQIIHIRRGALLHDIGKLGVPDAILLKPEKLTEEEWIIMRKHPQFAYEMLAPIEYLYPALDIPYCHHEKWDGTGYPRGLKGEQIPLVARMFAIVDVWDALRSDRPYRKAWSEEKVVDYIREQAGKYFDPNIIEKFFSLLSE